MPLNDDCRDPGIGHLPLKRSDGTWTTVLALSDDGFRLEWSGEGTEPGRAVPDQLPVSQGRYQRFQGARRADLNDDGHEDLVVEFGDCWGRSVSHNKFTILLSNARGYRAWELDGWLLATSRFYRHWFSQRTYLVFQDYSTVKRCLDGKEHNFFIHQALRIEGDRMLPSDEVFGGEAVWVQFKDAPHNKPTALLNAAMKMAAYPDGPALKPSRN